MKRTLVRTKVRLRLDRVVEQPEHTLIVVLPFLSHVHRDCARDGWARLYVLCGAYVISVMEGIQEGWRRVKRVDDRGEAEEVASTYRDQESAEH